MQMKYTYVFLSAVVFCAICSCSTTKHTYHLPGDPINNVPASADTMVTEYIRKSNGKPTRKMYSAGGELLFEESFKYRKDGRFEVTRTVKKWNHNSIVKIMYYPDSTIQSRVHFLNGQKDGISVQFYPNGQVMSEAVYAFGKLKVVHNYFSAAGVPLLKGDFHDGNGTVYHYNKDSNVPTCYAVYKDGKVIKHRKYRK